MRPCFQDQIKNFPWTPDRVASLFKDVREDFFARGITDFPEIVKGLSAKYGLRPEIIMKGLSRPEGSVKRMTDQMWANAQRQRKLEMQARGMVPQMETPKWKNFAGKLINFPRSTTLFGHYAAFTKSHLADQAFYNPKVYKENFTQSWALTTKAGRTAHEIRYTQMLTDPEYVGAKRAGFDLGEGKFAREISEVTGKKPGAISKLTSKLPSWLKADRVGMAFEELQMSRFKIWKKEIAHLTPEERANPKVMQDLAAAINHDTGTIARSNAAFRFMFLSPRLGPAQAVKVFHDIPTSMFQVGTRALQWKKAAPAARYVARKAAILVGANAAILAANQGYYLWSKDERFKPNLTELKGNLFRPKVFGHSIPISPTIELAKLPFMMIGAGIAARKGDNKTLELLRPVLETLLGRQNPLFTLAFEGIVGQTPGSLKPTPFPGLIGRAEPVKGHEPQPGLRGWMEWAGTKLPIPIANYAREFVDELEGQGFDKATAEQITKAAAIGTFELGTSYHMSLDRPRKNPPPTLLDLPGVKQLSGQPDYKTGPVSHKPMAAGQAPWHTGTKPKLAGQR